MFNLKSFAIAIVAIFFYYFLPFFLLVSLSGQACMSFFKQFPSVVLTNIGSPSLERPAICLRPEISCVACYVL